MRAVLLALLASSACALKPSVSKAPRSSVAVSTGTDVVAQPSERTGNVPTTLLWPSAPSSKPPGSPSEFELNQGLAIDTLRFDYPRLFDASPDLSVFRDDIELQDLSGARLRGKKAYARCFDMLRFLRRTSMSNAEMTYNLYVNGRTIRMRWSAKLLLRDPAFGIQRLDIVDGVSVYELDAEGLIRLHKLENIVLRGHEQPMPVSLASLWPRVGATPELALPFFRVLRLAVEQAPQQPWLAQAQPTSRRAPVPVASAAASGETPMQRAQREQAEDAEKARRIAERRAPDKKGGLGAAFGLRAPQPCESSYDCESPMVCCDLIFASVCCTGGMMIPARPEPGMQRQAIPIPVERDSPMGIPPQYPGPPY